MQLTLIFVITIILLLVALVIPKLLDKDKKVLQETVKRTVDEYFLAHTEQNLEKRGLMFERLSITTDRVMSHILAYYGAHDRSVKQQLRLAMQANIITYDQFRVLKEFHHLRNEIVHEGLRVQGSNETVVYSALLILRAVLGT